jgi:hypothetical protein
LGKFTKSPENPTHPAFSIDMNATTEKFAAKLNAIRSNPVFRSGNRVSLDDPRMAVYWERLAEDLLRTDEEWNALLADTAMRSKAQREKVLARCASKR